MGLGRRRTVSESVKGDFAVDGENRISTPLGEWTASGRFDVFDESHGLVILAQNATRVRHGHGKFVRPFRVFSIVPGLRSQLETVTVFLAVSGLTLAVETRLKNQIRVDSAPRRDIEFDVRRFRRGPGARTPHATRQPRKKGQRDSHRRGNDQSPSSHNSPRMQPTPVSFARPPNRSDDIPAAGNALVTVCDARSRIASHGHSSTEGHMSGRSGESVPRPHAQWDEIRFQSRTRVGCSDIWTRFCGANVTLAAGRPFVQRDSGRSCSSVTGNVIS